MHSGRIILLGLALAALAASGCQKLPTLHVRHQYPSGLDLHGPVSAVTVHPLEVRGADDEYGRMAARLLAEQLREGSPWTVEVADGAPLTTTRATRTRPAGSLAQPAELVLTGLLEVETKDEATTQTARELEPSGRTGAVIVQDRLVRRVSLRQQVQVRRTDGSVLGTLLTQEDYDSRRDPDSRGELGLQRADEPASVKPVERIIERLLESMAATTAGMLAPQLLEVDIPLRDTPHPAGRQGLEAARRGDLVAAREHMLSAAAGAPGEADLAFNLAALEEALGLYDCAAGNYELAAELNVDDPVAREGAARMHRLLGQNSQSPETQPAASQP